MIRARIPCAITIIFLSRLYEIRIRPQRFVTPKTVYARAKSWVLTFDFTPTAPPPTSFVYIYLIKKKKREKNKTNRFRLKSRYV